MFGDDVIWKAQSFGTEQVRNFIRRTLSCVVSRFVSLHVCFAKQKRAQRGKGSYFIRLMDVVVQITCSSLPIKFLDPLLQFAVVNERFLKQVCIPIGCVPTSCWSSVFWGGGGHPLEGVYPGCTTTPCEQNDRRLAIFRMRSVTMTIVSI